MNTVWRRVLEPFIPTAKLFQPLRTTFVVKRTTTAPLRKSHKFPSLRRKHRVYETVEDNQDTPKFMNILLTKYVDDVGQPGEIVYIKEKQARLLLLKKEALYPSAENTAGKDPTIPDEVEYSSRYARSTIQALSKFVLNISMNKDQPWTVEPWHVRSAFRKAHVFVEESAITMPEIPITGPDMSMEDKEFYVTLTINKKEKVIVRCRLHHWATNPDERLPPVRDHWKFPVDTVFPEDQQISKQLPEIIPPIFDEDEKIDLKKIKRTIRKL